MANYYPVESSKKRPAILLLGGSEGGIGPAISKMALELQKEGFAALSLSYFGAPGQSKTLEHIPLERFDQAIDWLASQPNIDSDRLGVMGISKGAEAALIIASRRPNLRATVAAMPSHVAWQGIDPNLLKQIMDPPGGSWSANDEPIPYLPYVREYVSSPLELYIKSLETLPEHPDAIIAVKNIKADVLLICGEMDSLWPSCDMARQLEIRAHNLQGPEIQILAFDDVGHAGVGLPLELGSPNFDRLGSLGGTPEANNRARRDGWLVIIEFFRNTFLEP